MPCCRVVVALLLPDCRLVLSCGCLVVVLFVNEQAGVMLSLAFVHVIADGFHKMEGLAGDFPVASLFVMCGIMLMFITERASLDYLSSKQHGEGGTSTPLLAYIACIQLLLGATDSHTPSPHTDYICPCTSTRC